jgi:hypothetical protein
VAGEDAREFLQGQFTNDIRKVSPGNGLYGLWLSQKGRVLADGFIAVGAAEREFWVGSYFSAASVVRGRLEAFIVSDDVTVEDMTGSWMGVSLFGERLGDWLVAEPGEGVFFRGRRSERENWEWVFPNAGWAALRVRLSGAPEFGSAEMDRRRIAAGIPSVPADIGPGDLPNEGGLEAGVLSTTKGCYLGQEVMARIKSRGIVRRRLVRVAGPGLAPAVPADLWHEGEKVGQLRSAASDLRTGGFTGMAMLPARLLERSKAFALSSDAPPMVRLLE